MPASLELQRQYGSDLQVLFVECQGADNATAEAFAWRQKWMDTAAMWTDERPVQVEGNGLPKFALLDTEGQLILSGNPLGMKKQIEEAIAAQVKKAKQPPEGTPAKLAKTWATFAKGDIGVAIADCDKLGATDPALADAAKVLRAEMVARTEVRIARSTWLMDNGYIVEATELLTALSKSVKGCADIHGKVTEGLARATKPEVVGAESTAAKELASLMKKIQEKPFDEGNVKALAKLAEKHKGTKAGERATHMVELAKIKP